MSKAILVISNMPDKCRDCPLHEMSGNFDKHLCVPMQKSHNKFADKKPNWCPLQELPDEEEGSDCFDEYEDGYADGWNRCREEILGN